ncbi:MAG: helix-turn-helix transcriptional regulator [Oscillospiraceae bacterium]|nr:helix-turn-helix transcriptional regulator [Oscillospiraceae bacterium]
MNRLKELREFHMLTQEQCASIAYISTKSYIRYETGERVMPLDVAVSFAQYYKESLDYIAGISDISQNITKKPEINPKLMFALRNFSDKQQQDLADFLNSMYKK